MPARTRKSAAQVANEAIIEGNDAQAAYEASQAATGIGDVIDQVNHDVAADDAADQAKADDKPKRNRKSPLAPVPVDLLGEAEDVPEEEWASIPPLVAPTERDAGQLRIDAEVKDAFDQWVKAGKPHATKSPRKRRVVAPEHAPAVRHMIGNAARFHNVTAIISKPAFNADGKEIIVFSVRDKVARDRKADTNLQAIREWAKANGIEVADHGRISEDVKAAYAKANPAKPDDQADDKADDKADDQADDQGDDEAQGDDEGDVEGNTDED
jgi:hypothetical protein